MADSEHTEVGKCEGSSLELLRLEFVLSSKGSEFLNLCCDLFESLEVGVLNDWSDESIVGLNSDAHVDVLVFSDVRVLPGRVSLRSLEGSKSGSLDDHVVDRDL